MDHHDEVTIAIMLDACRKDYLIHTCYIKDQLQPNSILGRLEGTFGFTSTSGGWAAGLPPESSGLYSIFSHSPTTSAFKVFGNPLCYWPLKMADNVAHILLKRVKHQRLLYHSGAYLFRYMISKALQKIKRNFHLTVAEIPFELLSQFDVEEVKSVTDIGYVKQPTIFDVLRQHNKNFLFYGENKAIDLSNANRIYDLKSELIENSYDFIFVHTTDLDADGHLWGPLSNNIAEKMQLMDKFLEEVCTILKHKYSSVNVLLFSDHGMVEVNRNLDLKKKIDALSLKQGEDFVMFLDSPSARFWFNTQEAEVTIRNLLEKIDEGFIVNKDDYEELGVRFAHNKYWDLLFMCNPGVLIYPNYFQREFPVKGMHGYLPSNEDNQGFVLVHTSHHSVYQPNNTYKMIDLFPTLLQLIGLPIPDTSEGKSLIDGRV